MTIAYGKRPKVSIKEVGNEVTGSIWMKKIWTKSGTENQLTKDLDIKQMQREMKLLRLASRIASENNLSPTETYDKVLSGQIGEYTLSYLDEIEEVQKLSAEINEQKDHVITLLINERMAYPIVVKQGKEGNNILKIEPLSYAIDHDDTPVIIFSDRFVTLEQSSTTDSEELILTKTLVKDIEPGTIGYLGLSRNRYKFGDSSWTLEQTQTDEDFKETLKDEIYAFWMLEVAGLDEEKKAPPEQEQPMILETKSEPLKNTSDSPKSTGKKSTEKLPATA